MFRFIAINLALTSVALGALKYKGAVNLKPESIQNEYIVSVSQTARVRHSWLRTSYFEVHDNS